MQAAPRPTSAATTASEPAAAQAPGETAANEQRGGLTQRIPNAQLFEIGPSRSTGRPPERDPEAARTAIEDFEAGAARAAQADGGDGPSTPSPTPRIQQPPADADRNGLVRRVPGTHLAAALRGGDREAPTLRPAPDRVAGPAAARTLDPSSERDTLNAFLDGFAEGTGTGASTPSGEAPQSTLATQKEGGR